ncbi:hypothetical protein [Defluviimonas sp. SAOS-178_SWC]|uniref:hypothetical protein n=1 Tax=Defluviimonas sp. SAOS-178_SWC TaxID=3121287 RepID=UPI003221C531
MLLIGIPVALFVCGIGWFYFETEILYPRKYARLQAEADAWNRENWATGSALRVTVQVSSDEAPGGETAVATIGCYQKRIAIPGGLKGPPYSPIVVKSDGPDYLDLPFGPDAMHSTPLRDVCRDAFREGDHWQLPHVTGSHYYWSHIVPNDHSFSCFLTNDPRTTKGKVTRPTFVGFEKLSLRALLTAEAYDALPVRSDATDGPPRPIYAWWTEKVETQCWRTSPNAPCAPKAEAICGVPLR